MSIIVLMTGQQVTTISPSPPSISSSQIDTSDVSPVATASSPVHPSRLQINRHINQKLQLVAHKVDNEDKDEFVADSKYDAAQHATRIENGDKEKLLDHDNNNIVNYKYFSQIETLKKRSILPQIRYDQIMTNNETSLKAMYHHHNTDYDKHQDEQQQEELQHQQHTNSRTLIKVEKMEIDADEEAALVVYATSPFSQDETKQVRVIERKFSGSSGSVAFRTQSTDADVENDFNRAPAVHCHHISDSSTEMVATELCEGRLAMQNTSELTSKDHQSIYDPTNSVRSDEGYHSNGFHDDALTPPEGCIDSDDSDIILDYR